MASSVAPTSTAQSQLPARAVPSLPASAKVFVFRQSERPLLQGAEGRCDQRALIRLVEGLGEACDEGGEATLVTVASRAGAAVGTQPPKQASAQDFVHPFWIVCVERHGQPCQQCPAAGPVELQVAQCSHIGRAHRGEGGAEQTRSLGREITAPRHQADRFGVPRMGRRPLTMRPPARTAR